MHVSIEHIFLVFLFFVSADFLLGCTATAFEGDMLVSFKAYFCAAAGSRPGPGRPRARVTTESVETAASEESQSGESLRVCAFFMSRIGVCKGYKECLE